MMETATSHTVSDLVGLSPLLVDKDDHDEDDDLSDNAEEWPQGGQLAAHTQLNLILGCSHFTDATALIGVHVAVDVQIIYVQHGLVEGGLDLILATSAIGNDFLYFEGTKLLLLKLQDLVKKKKKSYCAYLDKCSDLKSNTT